MWLRLKRITPKEFQIVLPDNYSAEDICLYLGQQLGTALLPTAYEEVKLGQLISYKINESIGIGPYDEVWAYIPTPFILQTISKNKKNK